MRPDGNCRTCMVEIKGERVLAPSCCRYPTDGMEVTTDSARAVASQKMVLELLLSDVPETSYTLDSELDRWARRLSVGKPRFAARHQPAQDVSHPAIAVNLDACIQCGRCVRACREEQVNDVIGYAFRGAHSKIVFDLDDPMGDSTCVACGECVQACPTGALMPAREVGTDRRRQAGGVGVPVLRRGMPAHLPRQGEHDSLRAGQGRPGELEPAVRQGPLRLRLRAAQASPDHAADPQAGRDQAQGLHRRSGQLERGLPRGHLGRGARLRRQRLARHPRHLRQEIAGRLRLGEGHERRGLPVPEAGAHRVRLEQRRSLHAAVPRLERRGADGRHQLGSGLEPGARRRQGGSDLRDRREPDGQSSGRRDLDEERRQSRREADRRRSAPQRSGPACDLLSPVQSRYRRRAAERDASRHRRGGPGRRGVHPRSHLGIRRARREREGVLSGGDGADLRHRRRKRSARSPGCMRRRRAR